MFVGVWGIVLIFEERWCFFSNYVCWRMIEFGAVWLCSLENGCTMIRFVVVW